MNQSIQKPIQVIDYGGGNIGSLIRALERLSIAFVKIDHGSKLTDEAPIILPGVGAFGSLMTSLNQRELTEPLTAKIKSGVPFLGICVGLQVLMEASEESPEARGLGIFKGNVVRFDDQKIAKIPQIGWNAIAIREGHQNPAHLAADGYVYFVNSYFAKPDDDSVVFYEADYGGPFCAAVQKDNITAFQFHPEKSGHFGHDLIRSWVDANR